MYDTNGDGVITISDVINWLIWLFFLPGDSFLYFIMTAHPEVARFFEISIDNFHGFLSGIFSLIGWVLVFGIFLGITDLGSNKKVVEKQRELDKKAVDEDVKKIIEEDQKRSEEKWKEEKDHQD